ncbi:Fe-S cluster assembly protein SufD [Roseococcus suduntuyensis]|uniref:Fe-S cluster assembly protein SufD n=1 Tax=Roseococcus suduntuyensis TaxID=455361 RepID=A0A840ACF2_9PROT|nr:Fe-S cluster assembly protein SufD [Roseococcus suduntuyensis]MBB3898000.1 Fe-S cluster assembly protein SufD [Roseococcus suduntuyensis]
MNTMVTGAAAFLGRFEGLRERLPGGRTPWVAKLRAEAAESFRAQGLPGRRIEAWHYTDLGVLAQLGFTEALTLADEAPALPPARAAHRAVFVDGRFAPALSQLSAGAAPLAEALDATQGRLGALAQTLPIVALNTMLFEDGLVLDVPAGVDAGEMELLSFATHAGRAIAFHPRHLIRLGEGARLTLIDTSIGEAEATYLHNPVYEIAVAEGATLSHIRIQREGRAGFQLSTVLATVQAGGTYDNFTLNAGGRLVRNEIHVALQGPKAACHMNGAQLVAEGQHADTTTFLDHAAPDCASRQTYKTVLAGRSRGVFQGKILVRQAAQRTDGYQMNQALLLSDDAEINAKPQLEIYADDVKCSHGATVGALDEAQLFYLRARGIPADTARAMLVEAFLTEAIEGVTNPLAQEALSEAISGWWQKEAV